MLTFGNCNHARGKSTLSLPEQPFGICDALAHVQDRDLSTGLRPANPVMLQVPAMQYLGLRLNRTDAGCCYGAPSERGLSQGRIV